MALFGRTPLSRRIEKTHNLTTADIRIGAALARSKALLRSKAAKRSACYDQLVAPWHDRLLTDSVPPVRDEVLRAAIERARLLRDESIRRIGRAVAVRVSTFARAMSAAIRAAGERIKFWRARAYERRMLAHLTPRDWKDLGLSRCDVFRETRKPFWRS